MNKIIAGIVLATSMTTATADNTRADKIEYCYSVSELAKTIAEKRDEGSSISELIGIMRDTEGGGQFETIVLLVYENPDETPRKVKKVFLEVCLSNIKKSSINKQFKEEI